MYLHSLLMRSRIPITIQAEGTQMMTLDSSLIFIVMQAALRQAIVFPVPLAPFNSITSDGCIIEICFKALY